MLRKRLKKSAVIIGLFFAICILFSFVLFQFWELPSRLRYQDSMVVGYADGKSAYVFLSEDDKWRISANVDRIDRNYLDALLQFEDKRFYYHPGVDPVSITRAFFSNLFSGRRVSGASTLTMQLVRVLEPRPRTYTSKVIEIFRAMQLELRFSKREILESYLRFAPYGRNIEGIEAASLSYFAHSAKNLTFEEISILLAIPQNPNHRYPKKRNLKHLKIARDRVAKALIQSPGFRENLIALTKEAPEVFLEQIRQTKVPKELKKFPKEIPHLAFWLRARYRQSLSINTTIERGIQQTVEKLLATRHREAKRKGIRNASIVVVNRKTNEVVSVVGNFTFDNSKDAQIPGFAIQRSTGSVLKPFIAAAAIDGGLLLPETLVEDIPAAFGAYVPKNYDKKFRGLVRTDNALSKSLNLPFVNMLNKIGVGTFLGMLRDSNIQNLHDEPNHYGLSAAVGGIECSPLEIAALYMSLANGGRTATLKIVSEIDDESKQGYKKKRKEELRIMSQGASFLVRKMLRINDRPGFEKRRANPNFTPIFWKTGTSYGFRDAWAAGASPDYVAVVWQGNFDRTQVFDILGSRDSGPILFDVLETLGYDPHAEDVKPDDLSEIEVCTYSGLPPNENCPHRKSISALKHRVPVEKCPYHKKVDVEKKTGKLLLPSCRNEREYETRVLLSLPSTVSRFLRGRSLTRATMPERAEGCESMLSKRAPRIISPAGKQLRLVPGVELSEQKIALEADSDSVGTLLSWFIDGEFIDSAPPTGRVWWVPDKGTHEIVVMDESGRARHLKIVVK